jgi:hypothetical protein
LQRLGYLLPQNLIDVEDGNRSALRSEFAHGGRADAGCAACHNGNSI